MFSNEKYLPPEIVFEILTLVYDSVETLGGFLSLRKVNKTWKHMIEDILKRQWQPPRRCQVTACLEYENEDYFKDFCIPAHTMASDEHVVCGGVPRKRTHDSSHFGEYLLQKLTLVRARGGLDDTTPIGIHPTYSPACVTAIGKRRVAMTDRDGRIVIKDFHTGIMKRTIATGAPGIIKDMKVLNLHSSEYLVWLCSDDSLGISEMESPCGASESLESDWRNEVKPFTQLIHSKELPSALMAMGPSGKCPKVFFIRIDPDEKVMTVVRDWQDFQWVFWNNLPTWVNLKTNQRRMDWRYSLEYMSVVQRLGLQSKVGSTTPDKMWVFNNERLILMTFNEGSVLDIQVSFRPDPCFESNFVTKRHRRQLAQSRVTAIFYSAGVLMVGFSDGSVRGHVLKAPSDAINIDMDSPSFTLHADHGSSQQQAVMSISMSKFYALNDSVKILVQYCDKVLVHSIQMVD